MGYSSRYGKRPYEWASRSAHTHVINDSSVQAFLSRCDLPKRAGEVSLSAHTRIHYNPVSPNPISHIIAIDGGFNEVAVQREFPSATICFFQFGALIFSVQDLEDLHDQAFIDPEDMNKLKRIQRSKLVLPVRNVCYRDQRDLIDSVRVALHNFFRSEMDDGQLMDTLKWFIFQEYSNSIASWNLASCPVCHEKDIPLRRKDMNSDYTFHCDKCGARIFLTDVFRLHEAIDNELGAGGILGYVTTTIEQVILVHVIRTMLKIKPQLLGQTLFVKDGPLAFFGQTANMHKPMRELVKHLFDHHDFFLAGLEKSGPFVEHADEISGLLENSTALVLDNDYIYRYILPGQGDPVSPYGSTTYYGNKLIFKTRLGQLHVLTLPTAEILVSPGEKDFRNLQTILTNVEKLRCDMYDNSLMPVALVNKLVSLANHPSSKILHKFAVDSIGH